MSRRWTAIALSVACACAHRPPSVPSQSEICRDVVDASGHFLAPSTVVWRGVLDGGQQAGRTCATVGPVLLATAAGDPLRQVDLDDLTFVSWNVHVGFGDVAALVGALRSGAVLGKPAREMVLLVQEAMRRGPDVPPDVPRDASVPRAIRDRTNPPHEVLAAARSLGLHVAYVPSVRNGRTAGPDGPEDRGVAILSTLPLSDVVVVELPQGHQRRVAVGAVISGRGHDGDAWRLRVVSVHLDTLAGPRRLSFFASGLRARQARVVLDVFRGDAVVVVGADLNTWSEGPAEPAVREFTQRMRESGARWTPTFKKMWRLDYLFYALPGSLQLMSRVLNSTYGSDHRPLVGSVRP